MKLRVVDSRQREALNRPGFCSHLEAIFSSFPRAAIEFERQLTGTLPPESVQTPEVSNG